jgi:hypothetical protein
MRPHLAHPLFSWYPAATPLSTSHRPVAVILLSPMPRPTSGRIGGPTDASKAPRCSQRARSSRSTGRRRRS